MSEKKLLKIALITSFPLDLTIGSGVVRMVLGYAAAFKFLDHQVKIFHPQFKAKSYLNLAVKRLAFNKSLSFPQDRFDLVLVSDFDGFILKHLNIPKIALNAGILADIIRFETGQTRHILTHLAKRECQNVKSSDLVVAPSKYTASKIKEHYQVEEQKIAVVPLGIDLPFWKSLRKNSGRLKSNSIHILCVARHYPRKGIADLLKAFKKVIASHIHIHLTLVGGGPQLNQNRRLANQLNISANVSFVGDLVNQQQLAEYYQNADIFCLPSYHETFGLVFLEAMFFDLPIVAYASSAVPEVVNNGCGFLCPPGDVDCLSKKLLILAQNEQLRKIMGQKGKLNVERFSWLNSARELLRLWGKS